MAITVTLQDYPTDNIDAVAQAVNRFRRELERRLGDRTEDALRAFRNAGESSAEDLTKEEVGLASEYRSAYEAARTAGLRGLGNAPEAYFEVRPA